MSGKFFLDTNIFVYSLDSRSPKKAKIAQNLIRRAVDADEGMVSYQVVQEFFNVALRGFVEPMTPGDCEQYLAITMRPLLAVNFSPSLCGEALRLHSRHSLSWYDALIVAAAMEGQCEVLYSEDLQHGRSFAGVSITNPFVGI